MINHLNFVARSRDLDTIEEIGFEVLLCLFHNHRPMQEVRGWLQPLQALTGLEIFVKGTDHRMSPELGCALAWPTLPSGVTRRH